MCETIGILSEGSKGWKKELNLISWNGREPKYDIRDWSDDHSKMGKGVTLSKEEFEKLKEILTRISKVCNINNNHETTK
ncbi:YdbC family protein, partial [Ammoniphilus sp. 3BR4]|uniref:YdbC family protein n=1 Tax=Ammoniphilus sp. 3BR4 TaxID=3158265 RepID=UPI003466CCA0